MNARLITPQIFYITKIILSIERVREKSRWAGHTTRHQLASIVNVLERCLHPGFNIIAASNLKTKQRSSARWAARCRDSGAVHLSRREPPHTWPAKERSISRCRMDSMVWYLKHFAMNSSNGYNWTLAKSSWHDNFSNQTNISSMHAHCKPNTLSYKRNTKILMDGWMHNQIIIVNPQELVWHTSSRAISFQKSEAPNGCTLRSPGNLKAPCFHAWAKLDLT